MGILQEKNLFIVLILFSFSISGFANLQHNCEATCSTQTEFSIEFKTEFEQNLKAQLVKNLEKATTENGFSMCWAPNTTSQRIQEIYDFIRARGDFPLTSLSPPDLIGSNGRFEVGNGGSWLQTAKTGAVTAGSCFTLSWSIVPDGTMVGGFNMEPVAPSNLIAELDLIYGCVSTSDLTQSCWFNLFQDVFDEWEDKTSITYEYEPSDDGAPMNFNDYPFLPDGLDGVRGDVRISGLPIDGDAGVLAYNFLPGPFNIGGPIGLVQGGDMFIDMPDLFYTFENANSGPFDANNSIRFRSVVAHEHGHGLGLSHSCPLDNQSKLMEPFASITPPIGGPQLDDILGAQTLYGDSFCEVVDALTKAAETGTGTPQTFTNLSVENNGGTDVYEFTVAATCDISIEINPNIGTAYLAGPQEMPTATNPSGCTPGTLYDPNIQANLDLAIIGPTGSLGISANAIGSAESLNISLPDPGTYQIVITNNGAAEIQAYEMTCTLSNCVVPADRGIPTMGEWGLICLGFMFLIFGTLTIRQRQLIIQS